MHTASKDFLLAMGVTCYFSCKGCVVIRFLYSAYKEITLNYTENYKKQEVLWKYDFKDYVYYILRRDSLLKI